jgi:hypothetical protein
MKAGLLFALLVTICIQTLPPAYAGDWRSKYSTGRMGETFEACCGVKDCQTAESLGFPEMKRHDDGSYDVKIGGHWLRYDFPAVHASEDAKTWVCYMKTNAEPEPLCLFFPPGII